MTLTTTLVAIRAHGPCAQGWERLLASLGKTKADDEPLPLEHILSSNGIADALWALRALPQYANRYRLFAAACACRMLHLADDPRSVYAVETAVLHAFGEATKEELSAARAAAWDAAQAARDAAWDAAQAARAAARAAAWAARDAARDAAWAARAARYAEKAWQAEEFRRMCRGEGPYGEV